MSLSILAMNPKMYGKGYLLKSCDQLWPKLIPNSDPESSGFAHNDKNLLYSFFFIVCRKLELENFDFYKMFPESLKYNKAFYFEVTSRNPWFPDPCMKLLKKDPLKFLQEWNKSIKQELIRSGLHNSEINKVLKNNILSQLVLIDYSESFIERGRY